MYLFWSVTISVLYVMIEQAESRINKFSEI